MGNPIPDDQIWKCDSGNCIQEQPPSSDKFRTYEECMLTCPALTGCSMCANTKGIIFKMTNLWICGNICTYWPRFNRYGRVFNLPILNGTYYIPHVDEWDYGGTKWCRWEKNFPLQRAVDAAYFYLGDECNGLPQWAASFNNIRWEVMTVKYGSTQQLYEAAISATSDVTSERLVFFKKSSSNPVFCNTTITLANTVRCGYPYTISVKNATRAGTGVSYNLQGTAYLSLLV